MALRTVLMYGRYVPVILVPGFVTGGAITNLIKHPKEGKGLLKYSVYGGLANTAIFSVQNLYFKYISRTPTVGPARMKPWLTLFRGRFLAGSALSLAFFTFRPFIARLNEEKLAPEKQLDPALVSSITGGVVGMSTIINHLLIAGDKFLQFNPRVIIPFTLVGIGLSYLGHLVVDRINKKRLRVMTRYKYPELAREYDKSTAAIEMMQHDPAYDGPKLGGFFNEEAEKLRKIKEKYGYRRPDSS